MRYAVIEQFQIGQELHHRYEMPVLMRRHDEASLVVVSTEVSSMLVP